MRLSGHQQVTWSLTVKAVVKPEKTLMLTDAALRNLKPKSKIYKASDRDGMYVTVSPGGTVTFRYVPHPRTPRDADPGALWP